MKKFLTASLLFLLPILIFAAYSYAPFDLTIDGEKLRKLDLPDIGLSFSRQQGYALAIKNNAGFLTHTVKIDTTAQVILLTGDSMVEGLAKRLREYVKGTGHGFKSDPVYSTTTISWAYTDTLRNLVRYIKPTYLIMCLGSNQLFAKNLSEIDRSVKQILLKVKQLGIKKFVWIGPPNWTEDSGINEILLRNLGRKRFFISKNLQLPRKSDGAHPTDEGAVVWADTFVDWLLSESMYPIELSTPQGAAE